MIRFVLLIALAAPAFAATPDASGRCTGTPAAFNPGPGDWNGWGVDSSNARFQPRPGLAASDVSKLKVKWAFGFPGEARMQAQPVIVGGRVFVGTTGGKVYSLDASTGCIYWEYDAAGAIKSGISIVRLANPSRWVAFVGDAGGYAHAVDARTGEPIWKTHIDPHPAARVTGSPTYYRGRLYVPVASGEETLQSQPKYECCTFRGSLAALDAKTGRVIWKTYTVPDPARPYKKNAEGTQLYGPAGAGIWSAPTIDAKRKRIYVGSGNSYTGIDLPTSDAVLAFDLDSGSLLWSSQVTPRDNWIPGCPKSVNCPEDPGQDLDFGSSPVLRTAGGKEILVATQKSGVIYGLDPDERGKVLWKTRLGVGSGLLGGIAWGAAYEGNRAYAAIADYHKPDGTPGLYSVSIDTGEKLWSAPAPKDAGDPSQAAAVSAMPGVVFSGSFGGHLRAYSTADGKILWDFDARRDFETVNHVPAKGGSFDGGGVAIAHGMIVTTSGYGFAGGQPGNVLLAFSVDGK
ncbi:MAG TPA: PQQ-binding-like beta-propeller repeat protein [Bryobacteraceae bacterium]|nr:PQQ-binding-like beta-propeller repeat protein [Bryobacteraceae bacterium]